jgi:hypothetical protein
MSVLVLAGLYGEVARAQPEVPLRVLMACSRGQEMAFRVTIENVGATPVPVVLGGILGYHKKYFLGSTRLIVRRDPLPEQILNYVDPSIAAVAGRVDPWLVPLPPGGSYTIVLPARHFVSPGKHVADDFSSPARLRLELKTFEIEPNVDTQGLQFVKPWIGTVTTDWIEVPQGCRPAGGR